MTDKSAKVLALEPYYGGSHRSFLDGLADLLPNGLELITLPPYHWKWRMRLSAPWLAEKLSGIKDPDDYGVILCSTFVDVAVLKGLMPDWCRRLPLLTYFHENQFVYPVRIEDERDHHFGLTNLTTALASDRLAFNSRYNLESFLAGYSDLLNKSSDMELSWAEEEIRAKSTVIPPGQDFDPIDRCKSDPAHKNAPVIVWNHRWEHDKNPELFFETLFELDARGIEFNLVVLGESFRTRPEIFDQARERLSDKILQFGFAESREEYCRWLKLGDVAVSTADHEFFGISVIEAVRAGCRPLLPEKLSYPELFPSEFLYRQGEFADRLEESLVQGRLEAKKAHELTDRFSWGQLKGAYHEWLFA